MRFLFIALLFSATNLWGQETIYTRSNCVNGKAGGIFPCNKVDMLAYIPIKSLPTGVDGAEMSGNWGWTDAQTGREFILAGMSTGTAFIEVTDPEKPVITGFLPIPATGRASSWREIKVYQNHAFIVGDSAGDFGVQIFNLRQLLTAVPSVATRFTADMRYTGVTTVHDVVINEQTGMMYLAGSVAKSPVVCGRGLHVVDIRDPLKPTYLGCFNEPRTGRAKNGYVHDAQCVIYRGPDNRYAGKEVCFSANETHLNIVDVSDKKNMTTLSIAGHPNASYVHQGWLTPDHRYFFVNDELDESGGLVSKTRTIIYDVTNLTYPFWAKEYFGTTGSIDHNLYIRGRYMFQSNYTSGLRIIDIQNPLDPKELAFFDTYPDNDNPIFEAIWNSYPFFNSGAIALNSIGEGVFVVKPQQGVINPNELITANEPMKEASTLPQGFTFDQNYPNPFEKTTRIRYTLPKAESIQITVYDALGQEVKRLVDGVVPEGTHEVVFDASSLANGVYLYEMKVNNARQVRSLVVQK